MTALLIAGSWSIAQSQPAARVGDTHVCPLVTGLVPHVGGPVLAPGVPTVLIGGMQAAVVGTVAFCVGPPDTIALGDPTVLIGGLPAARMGDLTMHGGSITSGAPTVLIGGSAKVELQALGRSSHASSQTRSPDEVIAGLQEQVDSLVAVLTEFGENEAVRNALASTLVLQGGLYEETGDEAAARAAREQALAAIEPAVSTAEQPYVLVTYVHALVLNGRTREAIPVVDEIRRREWNDPHFNAFCERHHLPTSAN